MRAKRDKTTQNSRELANPGENLPEDVKFGLFDSSKLERRLGGAAKAELPEKRLDELSLDELLELHGQIETLLPPSRLADLDLEREVVLQFHRTRELYAKTMADGNTPANQKAQVANSLTTILDQLIKMQTRLYSAERVKAIEQALVRTLKELDERTQKRFFELYERQLANMNTTVKEAKYGKDKVSAAGAAVPVGSAVSAG